MRWQVESLIATLILLCEELLPVLVQVFRNRQVTNDLTWVWLFGG